MSRVFMSRQEAKVEGLKFYHPGFTCYHDHDSYHYTSTGQCVQCRRVRDLIQTTRVTLTGTRAQVEAICAVWQALTGLPIPAPKHGTVVPNATPRDKLHAGPGHGHRPLTHTTATYPEFDQRVNRKPGERKERWEREGYPVRKPYTRKTPPAV